MTAQYRVEVSSGGRILLVQPIFPWASKSKNSHQSIPYGLLRIANWMKSLGIDVRLGRGNVTFDDWIPDEVWITSLFTYWAPYVEDAFDFYSATHPRSRIIVGGILPSLSPDYCFERFGKENVHQGLLSQAESFDADYSLLTKKTPIYIALQAPIYIALQGGTGRTIIDCAENIARVSHVIMSYLIERMGVRM